MMAKDERIVKKEWWSKGSKGRIAKEDRENNDGIGRIVKEDWRSKDRKWRP